ncbi:MAG: restriction endonuclease subunit S [Verrucomicrobiota bacterium]
MSVSIKPGYKQTDVGVIPEEWDVCPVGQKGEILTGKALAVNGPGRQRPYLRTKNVFDGRIDIDDVLTMPMTDEQFANFRVRQGDVLLNEGQSLELVGRCAMYQEEYPEPCAIQNQLIRFRARSTVSGIFASYLFRHCQQTGVFARIALQTTSIAHLGGSRFARLQLAWPKSEAEQRAIAEALSDVDALLGALDRLIAKKHDLKQAAMQQLLTGQTRLPGFHGEWEVKRLGELGEISGSGVDKKSRPDEIPVRLVNYMDVYRRAFIFSEDLDHWVTAQPHQVRRCAVQKGDVFFTPSSETRDDIANSAVAMEDIADAAYSYHLVRLRLKEPWDLCFRTYAFKTHAFLNQAETICDGGGTRYVISLGKFRSLTVNVPPLPEQTAIAAVLSDMDAELAGLEQRREKTLALKQGMMQELLTGRTRLL